MKKLMDFIYHEAPWLHKKLMRHPTYFRLCHIYWDFGGIVQMYEAWMTEKRWIKDHYKYKGLK